MHSDNTEKIDRYLLNEMSEKEKKAFDEAINQNEDLAKEVEVQKEMIDLIEHLETKNKIEAIKYIGKYQEKPAAKKRTFPVYFLAAASFLLLVSFFIFNSINNNGLDNIADQYYNAYLFSDERSIDKQETKNKAIHLYQQSKHKEAIPHLKQIADDESEYQLMLGNSYYETNKYKQALQHFSALLDTEEILFKNEARWYAALSHLQLNEPDQAIQNLTDILNDENAAQKIRTQAEGLLSKIDKH